MTFIDAHCHLSDLRIFPHVERVIELCRSKGIWAFVMGGVDTADWDRQMELARRFPGVVFPCFGVHPWFVAGRTGLRGKALSAQVERALELLPRYLDQAVGLGELGMDLGKKTDPSTEDFQIEVFKAQLKLAREKSKPLVLHIVHAHQQALSILAEFAPFPRGGIVHAFGGSKEVAQRYHELGFHLSIGGSAACSGHESLKRCLRKISLDWLVFESDSPDQVPDGFQGIEIGLNDPRSLYSVAQAIVALRDEPGITVETLLEGSRNRLQQIFPLELRVKSL